MDDLNITRKLVLLVAVPLTVMVGSAGLAVSTTTGEALDANRLRSLTKVSAEAGELAHRLQSERAAAAAVLWPDAGSGALVTYHQRTAATDESATRYRKLRKDLGSIPGNTKERLRRLDAGLTDLTALREQVQAPKGTSLTAVVFRYRILIADALDYRDSVAQAGGAGPDNSDRLRAAAALSHATEWLGQQQTAVLRALASSRISPSQQQDILATRTGYDESETSFESLADEEWLGWLELAQTGPEILAVHQLEDAVSRARVDTPILIPQDVWTKATADRIARISDVERRVDASVLTSVSDERDSRRWWAIGQAAAVLLALAAAVLLVLRLGRPMTRELLRLRDTAHEVAYTGLPDAVAKLQQGRSLDGATADEIAERAGTPIEVRGKDEIAEVGSAFNTVFTAAVRIAAEQAVLRAGIATVLVALARRNQRLTDGLVKVLDEAEAHEHDPDRLKRLYSLDHLVQRMGRNNTSLLVLGGEGTARVREDALLLDVARAAIGRIERFTRVDPGAVDPRILIAGRARDDVAHLLAELLDNATKFSRPETWVVLQANRRGDGAVLTVTDSGVGITPERLAGFNERLASPAQLDVHAVRAMGLTVAGHLATRYGITITLAPGPQGGTVAEVGLPEDIVVFRDRPGRHRGVPKAEVAQLPPSGRVPDVGVRAGGHPDPGPFEPVPSVFTPTRPQPVSDASAPGPREPAPSGLRFTGSRPPVPAAPTPPALAPPAPPAQVEPERRPERSLPSAPEPTESGRTTNTGLPLRVRRDTPTVHPGSPAAPAAPLVGSAGTPARANDTPDRRDARQVSAAMSAFAQGIGHSRARRAPSPRPGGGEPDHKERS
ncbi:nitrate- and nitrite sensing domain-containing protein [Embleya sp. NBC_00888]|uniref:sensor histidine kinase n=1 Tax=Embleya sp. NBC_00888 TaxID=2975960 RepID=UPI00386B1104|nr:nitrate- and nitrite sensing domain-containing protein [Embleya sp. NBC_00888]